MRHTDLTSGELMKTKTMLIKNALVVATMDIEEINSNRDDEMPTRWV